MSRGLVEVSYTGIAGDWVGVIRTIEADVEIEGGSKLIIARTSLSEDFSRPTSVSKTLMRPLRREFSSSSRERVVLDLGMLGKSVSSGLPG